MRWNSSGHQFRNIFRKVENHSSIDLFLYMVPHFTLIVLFWRPPRYSQWYRDRNRTVRSFGTKACELSQGSPESRPAESISVCFQRNRPPLLLLVPPTIPAPGAPDSGSVWIRASLLASSSGQNNAAGWWGTVHSLCLDPTRVVGTSTAAAGWHRRRKWREVREREIWSGRSAWRSGTPLAGGRQMFHGKSRKAPQSI